MRILSPADPIFKSDNESGYSDNYGVEALNNIKRAIKLYHRQLQNKYSSDELDTNGKYIGL
jgi:hypothetical protein